MGERTPTIEIIEIDTGFAGTVTDESKTSDLLDVSVSGDNLRFTASVKSPMGKIKLTFNGSVYGDTLSGKVKTPMGSNPFSGERLLPDVLKTADDAT
jgi:hypothetical protein